MLNLNSRMLLVVSKNYLMQREIEVWAHVDNNLYHEASRSSLFTLRHLALLGEYLELHVKNSMLQTTRSHPPRICNMFLEYE